VPPIAKFPMHIIGKLKVADFNIFQSYNLFIKNKITQ